MNVDVTPLPGIGTRQDFLTRTGRRLGIVTHRDGHLELIISREDDPDGCTAAVPLTATEASALANLLGAPRLVAKLDEQQRDVAGINTAQLPVLPGSPYDGRTLGDTRLRTRTGTSVVAVVREGTAYPSPRPDFELFSGDDLIIVGTQEGLREAEHVLNQG